MLDETLKSDSDGEDAPLTRSATHAVSQQKVSNANSHNITVAIDRFHRMKESLFFHSNAQLRKVAAIRAKQEHNKKMEDRKAATAKILSEMMSDDQVERVAAEHA